MCLPFWGQLALARGGSVAFATRCYAVGIVLWLLASPRAVLAGVPRLPRPRWIREPRRARLRRVIGVELGIALALAGVVALRRASYDSDAGALLWLAGIVLLVVAFGEAGGPTRRASRSGAVSLRELLILVAILGVAAFFRLHRLGEWVSGIHGDECEAGLDALRALNGQRVPPFRAGWFGQGNLYYWGVALGMKAWGTGLAGLRAFSVACGLLLVLPTWSLARRWFGVRVALLAAAFLAISDVAVVFSRLEFSNVTTPLSLAAGFAFLFRGLESGRLRDFLLAGYAHAAGLYFYQGARLTPLIGLSFLAYLLLVSPLLAVVRLRGRAARRELARQQLRARRLAVPALVYGVALLSVAGPFLAFGIDAGAQTTERLKEKLVFNNEALMAAGHGVAHGPLFLGIGAPRASDAIPLPIGFRRTAASVQIARDGFWPRALWRQLVVTLSILTLRFDASSVYTFSYAPVAKPFEAVLVVLALAWTLLRVRDRRFGALALWFWGTVIAGGVLTIDAPYMARLVGILPVLAISAALSLDAWAAALESAGPVLRRAASVLVVVVVVALARQNFEDFFQRYTRSSPPPFSGTVGQASFVRETNARALAAGEPLPRYQELGAHLIYWGHSVNRFLNPAAIGRDVANASQDFPFGVSADAPSIFMVWQHNAHYLPVLEELFPGGREERILYGTPGRKSFLFTSYRVATREVARRHAVLATYEPASGPALSRLEPGFATGDLARLRLAYPARARLSGALFAPAFARYRLEVTGASGASLAVDGVPAFAPGASNGELVLARGFHRVELDARLDSTAARVGLRWSVPGTPPRPVRRPFVWDGGGGALLGVVRALPKGEPATPFFGSARFEALPLVAARVDSFLGFKDAGHALAGGDEALVAVWKGRLHGWSTGRPVLELHANRGARLVVDGRVVIDLPEDGPGESTTTHELTLGAGLHEIELWYSWRRDAGILELFVTPPGGVRHLVGFDDLEPVAGVWRPGEITVRDGPAPVLEDTRAAKARAVVDLRGRVTAPRAIAVTPEGELLVADTGGHRVVRLDPRGNLLGAFGRAGRGPGEFERLEDVAVGPQGRIYTLDSGFARVLVFSRDGKLLRTLGADAGLCTPAGFGLGADGAVFVADTCGGRIVKLGGSGPPTEIRPAPPEKLEQPVDVAVGADGLLYIADLTPRVIALDPATGAVRRRWDVPVGTLDGGSNLALDGSRLYMSDANRSVVRVFDLSGDDVESRDGDPSAPFNAPIGLACAPGGRLLVIDGNGARLQVFEEPKGETSR